MTKKSNDAVFYCNSTGIYQLNDGGKLMDKKGKRVKASSISSNKDPLVKCTKDGTPTKKERGIISVKEVKDNG